MHDAVLAWLEEHIFTPEALEHVIRFTETTSQQAADERKALEREQRDLKRRIANLLKAIETGGDAVALVKQVQTYEARQSAIANELVALRPVPRLAPTVVQDRLNEWRRLLRGSTTQARAVIQRVVDGRLTFTLREDGLGYDFTGRTRFDRLFTGCVIQLPAWMTRDSSLNQVFDSNDTLDADYGALLSKFYGK